MVSFVAIVAFLIALFSLLFTSQATAGVAGIAFACLLAIFARMGQADRQHREVIERLGGPKAREPVPPRPAPIPAITDKNIAEIAKKYGVADRS